MEDHRTLVGGKPKKIIEDVVLAVEGGRVEEGNGDLADDGDCGSGGTLAGTLVLQEISTRELLAEIQRSPARVEGMDSALQLQWHQNST